MQNITVDQVRQMLADAKPGQLTVLDVRQDWEYEEFHLPGANWIPLSELPGRLNEVSRDSPVIVYCRSGGRSRAGAMLIASGGHESVFSMEGGMLAWNGHVACGPVSDGLDTMLSTRTIRDALLTSYGMEAFLQDFYRRLEVEAKDTDAKDMYAKLARFEDGHMNSIYERYSRLEKEPLDRQAFDAASSLVAAEGGVEPEQFMNENSEYLETVVDIVGMAMMFEAQALDFYMRASRVFDDPELVQLMEALAREEQGHLKVLASFMDKQG